MSIATVPPAAALPAALAELVDTFATEHEPRMADIWSRYPFLTDEEDAATDTVACESMSGRFADYLAERGLTAHVVYAEQAEHPWADAHVWVRVELPGQAVDIDWTARQYHNLEVGPDSTEWVLDRPFPLVWDACDTHPVVGDFADVATVTAVHFA